MTFINIENHPLLMRAAALYARVSAFMIALKYAILNDKKGWTICGCVLLVTMVRSGITYSFGVFVVQLQKVYHRPLAEQDWIGTLSFCISLSMAPISVAFIRTLRHKGYWLGGIIGTLILSVSCLASSFVSNLEWMFLTHSLLYGVGSSLIYMASSLVIGEYFDDNHKYHVLATSILLCGYPVGSLVFNPINAGLVVRFGWRVAFRFASGIILVTGLACCWTFTSKATPNMERLVEESDSQPSTPKAQTPKAEIKEHNFEEEALANLPRRCCTFEEVKKRPEIVLWYLGNMLSYLGFFMPFLNLAYYMKLKGIPTSKSSWCITLLSFAECITYIIASLMGDYLKGKLVYVNVISSAALSVICLIWPLVDVNYSVICVISMVMGGFLGLTIVYTYAASGEVTKLPIDIAWSFTNLWSGIGILFGPFFSGAIYDIRNKYDDVFYVVGALYVIDAIIFAMIPGLAWWRNYTGQEPYDNIAGGSMAQNTQTVKVPQRSISKNSLANEADGVIDTTLLNNAGAGYGATAGTGGMGGGQNGFAPTYLNNRGAGGGGGGSSTNPHNPFSKPPPAHGQHMVDVGGGEWIKPNNLETEQSNLALQQHQRDSAPAYGSRGQSIPLQSMPPSRPPPPPLHHRHGSYDQ